MLLYYFLSNTILLASWSNCCKIIWRCHQQKLGVLSFCYSAAYYVILILSGDFAIFSEDFIKQIAVVLVEHTDPVALLVQVLKHELVLRIQTLCVSTGERLCALRKWWEKIPDFELLFLWRQRGFPMTHGFQPITVLDSAARDIWMVSQIKPCQQFD